MKPFRLGVALAALTCLTAPALAQSRITDAECVAPANPGGGFDLTCRVAQTGLAPHVDAPVKVTFMPGGIGAVAYNLFNTTRTDDGAAIVAGALSNANPPPVYETYPAPNAYPPAPSGGPKVITYASSLEPWTRGWYEWCDDRYRSFNPQTGTYRGYDGLDHFCVPK